MTERVFMKERRKYRKVANNQRWLEGLWHELDCISYKGIVIRGKKQKNTCSIMQTRQMCIILVPVLHLKQMTDEEWNELARRMNGR